MRNEKMSFWIVVIVVVLLHMIRLANIRMSRPNYFLGIKLNTLEFQAKVSSIQAGILERNPALRKCFTQAKKLHITHFVMTLQEDQVEKAANVLSDCQPLIDELFCECVLELRFNSFGSFRKNVLFTHPEQSPTLDALQILTQRLQEKFREHNLLLETNNDWKPHVTIAKTSADRRHGRKLKIRAEDYDGLHEILDNIDVPLTTVDLLSMQEIDESGYYKSFASVELRKATSTLESHLC